MDKKITPGLGFMMVLTGIGGYVNAYTYVTRNGILANMHTANMSKLGISLASGNFKGTLSFFITICACIGGAFFSQFFKFVFHKYDFHGDWREIALAFESVCLFIVGFVPISVSDLLVTNFISFLMGFLLCLFKKFMDSGFNTTICTGNLRNVGIFMYNALSDKTFESFEKFFTFAILTFSFPLGAFVGTIVSRIFGTKSIWLCSFTLLALAISISKEKSH